MTDEGTKHILVVEDDPTISEVVARYLQREGYEAEIALDGEEALSRAAEINPDLVVLDLMLPKIDGYDGLPIKTSCAARSMLGRINATGM